DHRAVGGGKADGNKNEEIDSDAQKAEARDQQPGNGAGFEGKVEPAGERGGGGLGDADIGADRDMHADKTGRPRENGADQKADGGIKAEQQPGEDEDHDADDGDGGVLAAKVGGGAFAHGV